MKAIGLFSGGLDSALAIKMIQEQGIEVIALNFVSPFCTCVGKGCSIVDLAKRLGVQIKVMSKGKDYLKMLRHPKYGYGKNMNPCIDCKIYIFRKARVYAKEIGAKFLFTGEVVGQRPMSQHYKTLMKIEKESGLTGKLLRPLCAGLLPPTEAEKKGWVNREKLLKFEGRRRTPQLDLAKKYKIDGFMCGGSGCRLTDREFAKKLKDLFAHKKRLSFDEVRLLSFGRHFRMNGNKIIAGRNQTDNEAIISLKKKSEIILQVDGHMGPTTLICGKPSKEAIAFAAGVTARYSDAPDGEITVSYGKTIEVLNKRIVVQKISNSRIDELRIA